MSKTKEPNSRVDIQLSTTKVARIVGTNAEFPVWNVEMLGSGLEHQTFLVNDTWVFRFPKHGSTETDPRSEQELLGKLNLPVVVPNIEFIWDHPWGYPAAITGYRLLPGTALERLHTTELDVELLIRQIGLVLAELHSTQSDATNSNQEQLLSLRQSIENFKGPLHHLTTQPLSENLLSTVTSYLEQYQFDLPDAERVLIHGDLGADHLLVDPAQGLLGIIDWSSFTMGTRYRDFAGLWRWGGDSFCAQIFSHYPTDPSLPELAFIRALGLVSSINRVILLHAGSDFQLQKRTCETLECRLKEIEGRSLYEPLRG